MGRQNFETETLIVGGFPDQRIAPTLNAHFGDKMGLEDQHALNGAGLFVPAVPYTAHALRVEAFGASEDGTGRGTPLVPIAIQGAATRENESSGLGGVGVRQDGIAYTLEARSEVQAVAISANQRGELRERPVHGSLSASKSAKQFDGVMQSMAVRRLTPRECERLQGFPDDYTLVPFRKKPAADGPRYKALGNSKAVPVVRWIGERIQMVDQIETENRRAD